jgi:beta-phosphoglucomutase-like phosphatase (HAD superfamily)
MNTGNMIAGAAGVLEQVKMSGLEALLVTGSGQQSLIDRLNRDFPNCFKREKMVTGFDVKYGKPHPEPYLMGLEKAGVRAGEAIVVENAPLGIQSAVAAGIFTVAVNTGPLPDKILWDEGARMLFHDMDSLARDFASVIRNAENCFSEKLPQIPSLPF